MGPVRGLRESRPPHVRPYALCVYLLYLYTYYTAYPRKPMGSIFNRLLKYRRPLPSYQGLPVCLMLVESLGGIYH